MLFFRLTYSCGAEPAVKQAVSALDLEALHVSDIEQQDANATLMCWGMRK